MVWHAFFNGFEAACQVLSGSCVGFSSSFFRASESDVRQFFDGWFWRVGLGVSLFRMHVERCLSGLLSSIQARRKLLVHGRPPPGFPWFFLSNFAAACQVMSGSCVGFSSSFFRVSESDVRHFFDGWFWRVGLESCWGFPVSDAC